MQEPKILVKTVIYSVLVELGTKPLGRQQVTSIILRNPLTNPDGTGNVSMVLFGDGANQIYDLLPGQQTPEMYCADLKDFYVRALIPDGTDPASFVPVNVIIIAHRDATPIRMAGRGL